MMHGGKRWSAFVIGTGFVVFLIRTSMALQVTPGYQVVTGPPGSSQETELAVTNNEETDLIIHPSMRNWLAYPANKKFKVEDWAAMELAAFPLATGETKKVPVRVHIPKKASGELMGMMSFRAEQPTPQTVNMQISVALYAAVQGTEKYQGVVQSITIESLDNIVRGTALIKNKGNIHMRLAGIIHVYDKDSQLVANIMIPSGLPVFPGQERAISGEIKNFRLTPGVYYVNASLTDVVRNIDILTDKKKFKLDEKGKAVVQ